MVKHQPTSHSLEEIEQLCVDVETVLGLVRNSIKLAEENGLESLNITSFRNAVIAKDKLITFNQAVQRGLANSLIATPSSKPQNSSKTKPEKKAIKKKRSN